MADKTPEELLREKVVDAQKGGRVSAVVSPQGAPVLQQPLAPRLSGPPTPAELTPMLRNMRYRLRREQAHLDELIVGTVGQEQAAFELQRAKSQYLHDRDKDRLMERRESRETTKSQKTMDFLVDDMNKRFGTQEEYFRPYEVGDIIE